MVETDFCISDDDTTFMDKYPDGIPLTELIPFYESISRNEPIKLQWVCPGKIDPKPKSDETQINAPDQTNTKPTSTSDAQLLDPKAKEFDFDDSASQPQSPFLPSIPAGSLAQTGLPLRRMVGTPRHPPRQARVASMDKILNDLFKTRKPPVVSSTTGDKSTNPTTSTGSSASSNSVDSPRLLGQNELDENVTNMVSGESQFSEQDTPVQDSDSIELPSQQGLVVAFSESSLDTPTSSAPKAVFSTQLKSANNGIELNTLGDSLNTEPIMALPEEKITNPSGDVEILSTLAGETVDSMGTRSQPDVTTATKMENPADIEKIAVLTDNNNATNISSDVQYMDVQL